MHAIASPSGNAWRQTLHSPGITIVVVSDVQLGYSTINVKADTAVCETSHAMTAATPRSNAQGGAASLSDATGAPALVSAGVAGGEDLDGV